MEKSPLNQLLNLDNMIEKSIAHCLSLPIPLGGERLPLRTNTCVGEVDFSAIKPNTVEFGDLLLRGCIRGNPVPSTGFFAFNRSVI